MAPGKIPDTLATIGCRPWSAVTGYGVLQQIEQTHSPRPYIQGEKLMESRTIMQININMSFDRQLSIIDPNLICLVYKVRHSDTPWQKFMFAHRPISLPPVHAEDASIVDFIRIFKQSWTSNRIPELFSIAFFHTQAIFACMMVNHPVFVWFWLIEMCGASHDRRCFFIYNINVVDASHW